MLPTIRRLEEFKILFIPIPLGYVLGWGEYEGTRETEELLQGSKKVRVPV
tara:strand:+ start:736 stop:885 length:150 start_codon:yes stop_codon:yes gene_type:complete